MTDTQCAPNALTKDQLFEILDQLELELRQEREAFTWLQGILKQQLLECLEAKRERDKAQAQLQAALWTIEAQYNADHPEHEEGEPFTLNVKVLSSQPTLYRPEDAHLGVSKPEPPPKNEGRDVGKALLAYLFNELEATGPFSRHMSQRPETAKWVAAYDLIKQRYEFGLAKYGQPLMTEDGRNTTEDLKQELGDALMYRAKQLLQGNIDPKDQLEIQQLWAVLGHLITKADLT